MAFTLTQRQSIRTFLGWAASYFQLDTHLEQSMDAITAEAETAIVAELATLAALDTQIRQMWTRFKAASVGALHLRGSQELEDLRSLGRQSAGRIASMLGVEVRHDVFSGTAPSGVNGNFLMYG